MKKLLTAALLGGALLVALLTGCSAVGKPISAPSYTAAATAAAAPEEAPLVLPAASDFSFSVVELERSCFGSAGCNVTYTLQGSYVGTKTIPDDAEFRVLYKVTGADDPKTGYVTWRNGGLYGQDEDFVSVSSGSTLQAVAVNIIR